MKIGKYWTICGIGNIDGWPCFQTWRTSHMKLMKSEWPITRQEGGGSNKLPDIGTVPTACITWNNTECAELLAGTPGRTNLDNSSDKLTTSVDTFNTNTLYTADTKVNVRLLHCSHRPRYFRVTTIQGTTAHISCRMLPDEPEELINLLQNAYIFVNHIQRKPHRYMWQKSTGLTIAHAL